MLACMQAQEMLQHDRAGIVLTHDFFPQTHAKENLLENWTHFLNTPSTKTFPKVLHVKFAYENFSDVSIPQVVYTDLQTIVTKFIKLFTCTACSQLLSLLVVKCCLFG